MLNLSTSRVTEELARRLECPVPCTHFPVGEINVVERMLAENALLGGEGNGGVIDPRVGYVRDSFVAMAIVLDLLAATGETLSRLVRKLPQYAMTHKDQYPVGQSRDDGSTGPSGSRAVAGLWDRDRGGMPWKRVPTDVMGCGWTGKTPMGAHFAKASNTGTDRA